MKFGKLTAVERIVEKRKYYKHKYKYYKHGLSNTKEYKTWTNIKQRCYNPNFIGYKYYGGKGIKVCDRWLNSFENFLADIGLAPTVEHSIDRIDGNGDYKPDNVKWSTVKEQLQNRSNSKEVK